MNNFIKKEPGISSIKKKKVKKLLQKKERNRIVEASIIKGKEKAQVKAKIAKQRKTATAQMNNEEELRKTLKYLGEFKIVKDINLQTMIIGCIEYIREVGPQMRAQDLRAYKQAFVKMIHAYHRSQKEIQDYQKMMKDQKRMIAEKQRLNAIEDAIINFVILHINEIEIKDGDIVDSFYWCDKIIEYFRDLKVSFKYEELDAIISKIVLLKEITDKKDANNSTAFVKSK